MIPDLPHEIVRKIFRYNIPRIMDTYDVEIAKLYNILPCIQGSLQFLRPFSDEVSMYKAVFGTHVVESDLLYLMFVT